jgi:hypothetical protein
LTADTKAQPKPFIFQPAIVLLFSIAAASLWTLYSLCSSGAHVKSFSLSTSFFYVVPIIVPFVAFLFDRAEHLRETTITRVVVDAIVIGIAVGRVVAHVPLISGHTIFLTYAVFSSRSRLLIVSASLVMLQVIYLKYFVWHDAVSSTCGIVFGFIAAYLVNRIQRRREDQPHA